jgi:hypothetical protein
MLVSELLPFIGQELAEGCLSLVATAFLPENR